MTATSTTTPAAKPSVWQRYLAWRKGPLVPIPASIRMATVVVLLVVGALLAARYQKEITAWASPWFSQETQVAADDTPPPDIKVEVPRGQIEQIVEEWVKPRFDTVTSRLTTLEGADTTFESRLGAVEATLTSLGDQLRTEFGNQLDSLKQSLEGQLSALATQVGEVVSSLAQLGQGLQANAAADAAEIIRVNEELAKINTAINAIPPAAPPPAEELETTETEPTAPPNGEATTENTDMNHLVAATLVALTVGIPVSTLQAVASVPTSNPTKWMDQINNECPRSTAANIDISVVKQLSDDELGLVVKHCQDLVASGIFDEYGNVIVDEPAPMTIAPPPPTAEPPAIETAAVYGGNGAGGGHQQAQRGRTPRCPAGSQFVREFGKCVGGTFHNIQLSPEHQNYLGNCGEIETRYVLRGNKLVQQQRCKPGT